MKIIKRTFTLVLTLAVLLVGFTFPDVHGEAKAETTMPSGISGTSDVGNQPDELLQSGEWLYYLDGDEAIIAGYRNGRERSIVIPYSLDRHPVVGIGRDAFKNSSIIDSVQIHSMVTRISDEAFDKEKITIASYSGAFAINYAKKQGIIYNNLTNPYGAYYFSDDVIDFRGFPSKSYSSLRGYMVEISGTIAQLFQDGDVIFLPRESSAVDLCLLQVQCVNESASGYIMETTDVSSIATIIDRINYDNIELVVDPSTIQILNNDVVIDNDVYVAEKYSTTLSNSKNKVISLNYKFGNVSFKCAGEVSTQFSANASLDIRSFPLLHIESCDFSVKTKVSQSTTYSFTYSEDRSKSVGLSEDLFKVTLRDPITGLFALEVKVSLKVSITGSVTIVTETENTVFATLKNGKWNLGNTSSKKDPRVDAAVKGNITFPLTISAYVGVSVFGKKLQLTFAMFSISLIGEIGFTTTPDIKTTMQCADLTIKLSIKVSGAFGIVDLDILGAVQFEKAIELGNTWDILTCTMHFDDWGKGLLYTDSCKIKNRKAVFKYNNGQPNRTVNNNTAGSLIDNPGIPQKAGYVFGGWYFSMIRDDGSIYGGGSYIWDFVSYRLPYFPFDGTYWFEVKWLNPGENSEIPGPQPVEPEWTGGIIDSSIWHPEPPKPIEVTNITLSRTDEVLHVDGQYKDKLYLTATVLPANAADTSVTWLSSNPAVATVDQNGVVSAVAQNGDNHETIITCRSNMNPNVAATCRVNVFEPVYVKSITLDKTSVELWANEEKNNTIQLKATVDPANATYSSVHWTSSDEGVAWVDGWGNVTALSAGTATITCQSIKNQDITATCNVTVHQHVRNVYITAEREGLLPTETMQLSALCYPTNADNKKVNWTSSDSTVASVDAKGVVTARKYGNAKITAAATDGGGVSGSYDLTVEHELTLLSSIQNDKLYLDGDNSVVIGYAYATQGSVRRMIERGYDLEWSLTNGENAVADAYMDVVSTTYTVAGKDYEIPSVVLYSGELHKAGKATYTLQCKAGSYTATVDLAVTVSGDMLAKKVTLNPSKFELGMNEVAHIPSAPVATDGGVVPKIISVDLSGDAYYRSHAHISSDDQGLCVWFPESGQYTADVVYKAANTSYSVPVTFEVRDENGIMHLPVTNVALSDSFVNLVVGDTYQLSATVLPADAYDRSVTWTSEDTSIATVSKKGKVTAKARGMVYIRCEANDGSGCYDSCVLNIEPFMALNETSIEKKIYMDGQTHVAIDSCSLTYQSAIRIENAGITPDWKLRKISGDATEIAMSEFTSTAEGNVRIEGQEIQLLRANHTGVDQYQLICEAGAYSASCDIVLTVVEGGNLPTSIALKKSSYEAILGEEIEIDTGISCSPNGSKLPDDVNITLEPTRAFWNAMEEDTYFADFHCTFAEAGEYIAELVYSGANYRYAVPFTVRVKDENGSVPIAVQDIMMSKDSVQMLVGDSVQLSASVLPSNAAYGSITWSSFDTSVATVSSKGKVTAMDAGITYVIAYSTKADRSAICLVTVEDGLTLESESLTKTIFVDGATRTLLDTAFLTESSSKRLTAAPEWKLQRISGNNLTLRCSGVESANESGATLYGCNIILHSASAVGQTIYDLVCSYGNERATMRIIVNAVARDGNAPASIELSQTSYEANVNELIVVNPQVTCWPSGTQLPEGTRVDFVGNRQFLEAVNQEDWFVSQSISTFSFREAGRYEASCVYSYANISYTIPITFYIKDSSGNVPVHGTKMTLNTSSLQLVAGEESVLDAVFTPADATNTSVTWTSSNTSVATVDSNGRVKAKANGSAQITCTPADTHCSAATCYVTVEDYLTVETGNTSYSCYLEGEQDNVLSSAWVTEGTKQRLNRDNIIPVWTLTTTNGSSATVVGKPEKDGSAIRVSTALLSSTGTTEYTVTCKAGDYQWTQNYKVVVNAASVQAPETVTLATPEINIAVGEAKTINFAPVCQPNGSALPQNITKTYVGIGGFYDALDRSVYNRDGDNVTVAFTAPGRYLLARAYKVRNLNYTALCTINVGSGSSDNYGLLKTTEQDCTVFMNGKSGAVAEISITDSMVYERYGAELKWNVERLSGNSITAGLVPNADNAVLVVGDTEKVGTDVWRVSCSFGGITDFVDISIDVKEARKPIPSSIELSKQRLTGVTGDWLYLPLGVKCNPAGSALPEVGDEFWSFKMMGGLAEDVSDSRIENGMLEVCFSESGYYSGTLVYSVGTISYTLPVYFTISDEESQIDTPDQLKVWVLADSNTVYPEGDTGVPIATAVIAENLNSYYAGTAPSYAEAKGINWSISIKSGSAVTLGIRSNTANTADVLLKSIKGTGDVQYTVTGKIDGKTYTGTGTLHVAASSEARPDVTLIKSRYQVTQGIPVEISRMLYQRSNGGALQSAGDWNVGNALAAIGYSYETTDDAWKVTFYKKGDYTTTVSTYVGNLKYELPLLITVVGNGTEESLRTLKLPAALTMIEEEAFSGVTAQVIDLRGSKVKTIGSGAFKNCVDLIAIYIPNTVTSIADDAFYGCLNITIHCVKGSGADRYAASKGINVSYDMK